MSLFRVDSATRTYFSAGGEVAAKMNIFATDNALTAAEKVIPILSENNDIVSLAIYKETLEVDSYGIVSPVMTLVSQATVNKKTGEINESDAEALNVLMEKDRGTVMAEQLMIFAANAVYYHSPYLCKYIQETKLWDKDNYNSRNNNRSRSWKYYWLCVREPEFFEKLLKTQENVWNTQIENLRIQEFIRRFKDNGLPQKLLNEIENCPSEIQRVLNKGKIITLLQYITEKEDGNSARIFWEWLSGFIKLENSRPYQEISSYSVERFITIFAELLTQYGYNSKKLLDYLTRQSYYYGTFKFPLDEVTSLRDYLNAVRNIGARGENFPAYLTKAHNCAVRNNKSLNSFSNSDIERFKNLSATLQKHYNAVVGDFVIQIPATPQELVAEGTALSHCVAGYIKPMMNEETIVGFIRHKASPDVSLYTIEMKEDVIIQAKGAYNEELPESMDTVIKKLHSLWEKRTKRVKKGVTEDESEVQLEESDENV